MGKKRLKDQIMALILKTCIGNGVNKTHVVYTSGLNFYTIKAYLDTLNKNNLIEIIPGPCTLYKTTQKGKDALKHFSAIEELFRIG